MFHFLPIAHGFHIDKTSHNLSHQTISLRSCSACIDFFLLSQPKELHGKLCIFVFEGVFLSFKSLFLTVSARGSTYRITHQASFFPHGSNVPLA